MTFAMSESLARSELTECKSLDERTICVPATKRKYVQKATNISEKFMQNLSEDEMKC